MSACKNSTFLLFYSPNKNIDYLPNDRKQEEKTK